VSLDTWTERALGAVEGELRKADSAALSATRSGRMIESAEHRRRGEALSHLIEKLERRAREHVAARPTRAAP
jgi:hypothetical protein